MSEIITGYRNRLIIGSFPIMISIHTTDEKSKNSDMPLTSAKTCDV